MIIGVPKEIKEQEYRVAITPLAAAELVNAGHDVLIEKGAGLGSGFSDQDYLQRGARIVSVEEAWSSQLVVKVKEPLSCEYDYLKGQIIFTFLHLAGADRELTCRLIKSDTTAIAYETLLDKEGHLPILAPMSAIAGNMAALVGSYYLAKFNQGSGVQLGKVLGCPHGKVLVVGDGVVGCHAARTLNCMGAQVLLAGLSKKRVGKRQAGEMEGIKYIYSDTKAISLYCQEVDLVVGAVLSVGERAPYVITENMVKSMGKGSVVVDVSIDQGGCIETSKATTHNQPVYIKHDVIHYCVTNMPGAYPRSSTIALCDASLIYVKLLADNGVEYFMQQFPGAVNVYKAKIVNEKVAISLNMNDL